MPWYIAVVQQINGGLYIYVHGSVCDSALNAVLTCRMKSKISLVLFSSSTKMGIDGRLGDEVMTAGCL
jgi:hypothetical protein